MFNVRINTSGAAFHDENDNPAPGVELARILRVLAARIEADSGLDADDGEYPLIDINGNRCGVWHC